jgi:hypothetical protein
MPHLHKKIKKGRPSYHIREIARINCKPTVVSQIYLGSLERMLEFASGAIKAEYTKIQSHEYAALWLAHLIDQDIDLASLDDGWHQRGRMKPVPRWENISFKPCSTG